MGTHQPDGDPKFKVGDAVRVRHQEPILTVLHVGPQVVPGGGDVRWNVSFMWFDANLHAAINSAPEEILDAVPENELKLRNTHVAEAAMPLSGVRGSYLAPPPPPALRR